MRQTMKKKRAKDDLPSARQAQVQRDLAQAAGTEFFQYRDPLYHVTENFQQTFDSIGRSHALSLAGNPEEAQPQTESESLFGNRSPMAQSSEQQERQTPLRTLPNTLIPLQQFSQTAFQRGTMSASILAGTGKMMLVSCLKRTIGQSGPKRIQQESLFDTGSQTRNVPNRDPDQMIFNRTFANSAVGLVVDTLRDARRVVQSMEQMAQGTGELKSSDTSTLRAMYPFLDDSRERQLLEQYGAQLELSTDGRERAVLQNGLVHVRSLLTKKQQMKIEFTNKLRLISDRATEALEEFQSAGFFEEITSALTGTENAGPWEDDIFLGDGFHLDGGPPPVDEPPLTDLPQDDLLPDGAPLTVDGSLFEDALLLEDEPLWWNEPFFEDSPPLEDDLPAEDEPPANEGDSHDPDGTESPQRTETGPTANQGPGEAAAEPSS